MMTETSPDPVQYPEKKKSTAILKDPEEMILDPIQEMVETTEPGQTLDPEVHNEKIQKNHRKKNDLERAAQLNTVADLKDDRGAPFQECTAL